jgi:hypothetical protein
MANEIRQEDVDPAIEAFKKANITAVQKVIERARKKSLTQGKRNRVRYGPGALQKALDAAMSHHGRITKDRPSIRMTSPQTGGRPYHFGYTTVTKGTRQKSKGDRGSGAGGSGPAAGANGQPGGGKGKAQQRNSKRTAAATRESAHQQYVERDAALSQEAIGLDPSGMAPGPAAERMDDLSPEAGLGQQDQTKAQARADERGAPTGQDLEAGIELTPGSPGRSKARDESRQIDTQIETEPAATQDHSHWLGAIGDDRESAGPGNGRAKGRPRGKDERANHPESDPAIDAMAWVEETVRERPGLSGERSEAAAQAYIENPAKVGRQARGTTASFGTIGDTLEERMAFWDLVHEHESSAGGRTQSRLVLELPHEASRRARHEIVHRFTEDFERRGIPYWASIHEPTAENDQRNHHAHIVFTERPMRRMKHPETGEEVWDFTITEKHKDSSRHTNIRHPYRQNRDRDLADRGWIKTSRRRFAGIVNAVMSQEGVKVRYDPRSYKDMGLDVTPMANVSRILADKTRSREFVVMDAEWTRRAIDAEMREAAMRRDATYLELREVERQIANGLRAAKSPKRANASLPKTMQLAHNHRLDRRFGTRLAEGVLKVERDRLATKYVDDATERALTTVIEATSSRPGKNGSQLPIWRHAAAPDPEALRDLNAAATEELAAFRAERASRQRSLTHRARAALSAWGSEAAPSPPAPPPARPATAERSTRPDAAPRHQPEPPGNQERGIPTGSSSNATSHAAAPDPIETGSRGQTGPTPNSVGGIRSDNDRQPQQPPPTPGAHHDAAGQQAPTRGTASGVTAPTLSMTERVGLRMAALFKAAMDSSPGPEGLRAAILQAAGLTPPASPTDSSAPTQEQPGPNRPAPQGTAPPRTASTAASTANRPTGAQQTRPWPSTPRTPATATPATPSVERPTSTTPERPNAADQPPPAQETGKEASAPPAPNERLPRGPSGAQTPPTLPPQGVSGPTGQEPVFRDVIIPATRKPAPRQPKSRLPDLGTQRAPERAPPVPDDRAMESPPSQGRQAPSKETPTREIDSRSRPGQPAEDATQQAAKQTEQQPTQAADKTQPDLPKETERDAAEIARKKRRRAILSRRDRGGPGL